MAKILDGTIKELTDNKIDIDRDGSQTARARASRDNLVDNIINLAKNPGSKIPLLFKGKEKLYFGSFARSTKIQPLDDIDIMICFSAQGCTYDNEASPLCHTITNKHRPAELKPMFENDDTLNSAKLLNALKSSLSGLSDYEQADIHRRQEAVTLKLKSYPWNFDIVPCFHTVHDTYLIPDGKGKWKATDPRIDQNRITSINKKLDNKVIPIIRTMKYWKKQKLSKFEDQISSYMFETMILDYYYSVSSLDASISRNIVYLFSYLENAIKKPVNDPKGFQGDMNGLNAEGRKEVRGILYRSRKMLYDATMLEMERKTTETMNLLSFVF